MEGNSTSFAPYVETKYEDLEEDIRRLIDATLKAKELAYCPYSRYRVGAAVLTDDGTVVTGCNVENASYGLSVCAERLAILKSVSLGYSKFRAIAVNTDESDVFKAPCGACRQCIIEFGNEWDLYMVKPDKTVRYVKFHEILPMAFTFKMDH